jgi:hypothetical protein
MMEKFDQSSGTILGYKVTDKITKEDYATLTADVQALVQQEDNISLLLDMKACTGEEIKAWCPEPEFRRDYRKYIAKMAVIRGQEVAGVAARIRRSLLLCTGG